MTLPLLLYLATGALLYTAALIGTVHTRQRIVAWVATPPPYRDAINTGAEFLARLLLAGVAGAVAVAVWPLVWGMIVVGMWRMRKEKAS